jgi:hypothetical protein
MKPTSRMQMKYMPGFAVLCACVVVLSACAPVSVPRNPVSQSPSHPAATVEGGEDRAGSDAKEGKKSEHFKRKGPLTEKEMGMARIAWKYFENNYQPNTGLVNAVEQYPSTTMWDTASYLGGLVAARELGIIDKARFDERLKALLKTLQTMGLFHDELPNKAYNTQTAQMVNYNNKPGEIGFSALDLGRFLTWLKIVEERYPEYADDVDSVVLRWNFCGVLDRCGTMYGAFLRADGKVEYSQEGRLGYEEYSAKGFQLWGFGTKRASMPEPFSFIRIYGVDVPYDTRDPRELVAHNYVVCENYMLDGIEFNWDRACDASADGTIHSDALAAQFANRIYLVQEKRHQATGILTARTEHQLDGPPYFVYDTIYSDGYPWNTITENGNYVPQFAAVAFKGAIGLWVLWNTPYTDLLFSVVSSMHDPQKGFYEGRYEKSGERINTFTANTQGIILEALLYKVQGKLLRFGKHAGIWERTIRGEQSNSRNCRPDVNRTCDDNPR